MSSISKNDNSEFDFDLQDLNQGYISNRMLSDLDSLDTLLDDVPAKLPDPLPFASNSAPELKIEVARQPEPTHIPLPAPFNKANLDQSVDDTVLTPAELAIFEIEISKMATNELADFEDNSSKMAIANFEKPVSKMASDETSEFWEPARTQNAPKTPEMRAIQHVPQNGASLNIINTYNKTTQNTLKTPFTNHPKTGLKTKKQKITPKPTLFTLAKNEPVHTPDGIKPRPAITSRTIEELPDPFRRRWHDLNLNDKLALRYAPSLSH